MYKELGCYHSRQAALAGFEMVKPLRVIINRNAEFHKRGTKNVFFNKTDLDFLLKLAVVVTSIESSSYHAKLNNL